MSFDTPHKKNDEDSIWILLFKVGVMIAATLTVIMLLTDTQYKLIGKSIVPVYERMPCYKGEHSSSATLGQATGSIVAGQLFTPWASCDWLPERAFYVRVNGVNGWVLEKDLTIVINPYPFTHESNNNRDARSVKKLFRAIFR
jgi:hypothetical protein